MAWHHHTSLTNFSIQQSRSYEGIYVPLRLTDCLFLIPDSQPTATELFQSPLYGSGTVFCSISHLFRHFLSSALVWRHTSSNSVTRNYCCRAREVTLSFVDTLIALTYVNDDTRLFLGWPWQANEKERMQFGRLMQNNMPIMEIHGFFFIPRLVAVAAAA